MGNIVFEFENYNIRFISKNYEKDFQLFLEYTNLIDQFYQNYLIIIPSTPHFYKLKPIIRSVSKLKEYVIFLRPIANNKEFLEFYSNFNQSEFLEIFFKFFYVYDFKINKRKIIKNFNSIKLIVEKKSSFDSCQIRLDFPRIDGMYFRNQLKLVYCYLVYFNKLKEFEIALDEFKLSLI